MSKSTVKGIKKTAGFWDTAYRYTLKPIVDAGTALGNNAYKFTDGYRVEQELLKNGSRAKYTPKQKRWLAQGEYPTLRAINDVFNHAPNNAAQHIASNYTAPFLRDISGYNAIESAIKEHKLQNKLHSNQDQSIELVEKIGDLVRAPLGASPESLRKAHKKYSDDLRRHRDQRGQIQGDLNYQGAKTDASANNILMFSPMQKVLGWADLDHLVPQDTSHPAYLEYLQRQQLTEQQYAQLEAINGRYWATDLANNVLMSIGGGGAGLKLIGKGAPKAIQILTNQLISKGVSATVARRYATATVLMTAGYGGQQTAREYTNQLARWQREHGHTTRGYMALVSGFPNIVPLANTTSFTNVADAGTQHQRNTGMAFAELAHNRSAAYRPLVSIPYVKRDVLKQLAVGAGAGLFMPGTPLPGWATTVDNGANMLQIGAPITNDPTISRVARTVDPSTLLVAPFGSSGTSLAPQFNQWRATRYVLNPGDITTPDVPMVMQNIAGLAWRSDVAQDLATILVQANAAGVRWPTLDGAKKLLKSTNPKDIQLAKRQLDSALFGLMQSMQPQNKRIMSYIQLTDDPGAASMRDYYQRQLTSYVQSASAKQLADVMQSRIRQNTAAAGLFEVQETQLNGEQILALIDSRIATQDTVKHMYNQGIITKQTANKLLIQLSERGLVSLDAGGFGVQDDTPPPGAPEYPDYLVPRVRFEPEGL